MSYYTMAFVGTAPFGSLLAGGLAHKIGAPHTVMITGACVLAGAIWYAVRLPSVDREMRSAYQENELMSPQRTSSPGTPIPPSDDADLCVEESSTA
jgi:hypothetical protein